MLLNNLNGVPAAVPIANAADRAWATAKTTPMPTPSPIPSLTTRLPPAIHPPPLSRLLHRLAREAGDSTRYELPVHDPATPALRLRRGEPQFRWSGAINEVFGAKDRWRIENLERSGRPLDAPVEPALHHLHQRQVRQHHADQDREEQRRRRHEAEPGAERR